LKILAHVGGYPPVVLGGGEVNMATIMTELSKRHETLVATRERAKAGKYNGVPVAVVGPKNLEKYYKWADVVFTQLYVTQDAIRLAKKHSKPLVHFIHSHWHPRQFKLNKDNAQLIVYNSNWMVKHNKLPGIVLHPPIYKKDYKVEKGDKITLINLLNTKGAGTFYRLVEAFPDKKFLGVIGTRGKQVFPDKVYDNLTIIGPVTDMEKIYKSTRVLLMPSRFRSLKKNEWTESWGRCAIEAGCSGIPTIAHPAPGLKESLGKAGIFHDRNDIHPWICEIKRLDDEQYYNAKSKDILQRVDELQPDFTELEDRLRRLIK